MKLAHLVALLALALLRSSSAAPETAPELNKLLGSLEPVTAGLNPKPKVEISDQGRVLRVLYLPQTYKVHNVSKGGMVSETAYDQVGPSYKGFVLSVRIQPRGEVNQAVTPQTLRRPYWSDYLDVTPVAGSDHQVLWTLGSGARTDRKLLDQIREKVLALQGAARPE